MILAGGKVGVDRDPSELGYPNSVLPRVRILLVSAVLGAGAALGAAACGEDRGGVEVEGGTTGGTGTEKRAPTNTERAPTNTAKAPTDTQPTETSEK